MMKRCFLSKHRSPYRDADAYLQALPIKTQLLYSIKS